jgi:hypothetical protein
MEFCCENYFKIKLKKKIYSDDDRKIKIKFKPNKLQIKIKKPYSSTKYKSYSYYDEVSYPSVTTTERYYMNSPVYNDSIYDDSYDNYTNEDDYSTDEESVYEDDSIDRVNIYKRRNPSVVTNKLKVFSSSPVKRVTVVKRTRTPVSSVTYSRPPIYNNYSPSYSSPHVYSNYSSRNNLNDSDMTVSVIVIFLILLMSILLSVLRVYLHRINI